MGGKVKNGFVQEALLEMHTLCLKKKQTNKKKKKKKKTFVVIMCQEKGNTQSAGAIYGRKS